MSLDWGEETQIPVGNPKASKTSVEQFSHNSKRYILGKKQLSSSLSEHHTQGEAWWWQFLSETGALVKIKGIIDSSKVHKHIHKTISYCLNNAIIKPADLLDDKDQEHQIQVNEGMTPEEEHQMFLILF